MSTIDLSRIGCDDLYDAQLKDLPGRVSGSKPAVLRPEEFSRAVLARLALCLSNGVPINTSGQVVLGSPEWADGYEAPDLSEFPSELPTQAYLSEDGLGIVELHRGFKICVRQCKVPTCGKTFTQKRGGRSRARWSECCDAECRREWKNLRQNATRRA